MANTFFPSNPGSNNTSSLGQFQSGVVINNGLDQLSLNQRMNELRKKAGDQIHTRTNHISSSMRNYSPWFRALGLADDHVGPVQISFSNKSISVIVNNASKSKRRNHPTVVDGVHNMNNNVVSDDGGDGQIHSVSYQKNGTYTCSRCNQQFSGPHRFAAHARSHYKYESKAQRNNRLMSRIRKRNLCSQMVNGQLTLVPLSSAQAGAVRNTNNPRFASGGGHESINVKVEVDQVVAAPLLE